MKHTIATCVLAAGIIGTPSAAMAASHDSTILSGMTTASQSEVTIDGRSYGPEDGLVITTGSIALDRASDPQRDALRGTGSSLDSTGTTANFYFGPSYATSNETAQFFYQGRSYAAANIYGGKRIVGVCVKYTRGGADLTGNYCSNAYSNTGSWSPGRVNGTNIHDTLDPNAPQTIFRYSTSRIDPNIV